MDIKIKRFFSKGKGRDKDSDNHDFINYSPYLNPRGDLV